MSLSSWFRRRLLRENGQFTRASIPLQQSHGEKEEQFLGVTDKLIEFVKSFTFESFKNFPHQDEEEAVAASGDQNLSDWQERHAVLVLSKVKEISQLRYRLCPGHLKEQQFWKIYFALVKSLVVENKVVMTLVGRTIAHSGIGITAYHTLTISERHKSEEELSDQLKRGCRSICGTPTLPNYKINTDATLRKDCKTGMGAVIRNGKGIMMLTLASSVEWVVGVEMLEVTVVHNGLVGSIKTMFARLEVESDSFNVIRPLNLQLHDRSEFDRLLEEIQRLARGLN